MGRGEDGTRGAMLTAASVCVCVCVRVCVRQIFVRARSVPSLTFCLSGDESFLAAHVALICLFTERPMVLVK